MHLKKYHDLEENETEEGFQQNPNISEEITVQPSPIQGGYFYSRSIIPKISNKQLRYTSQQKVSLKFKALEQTSKYLKKSQNFKQHNYRYEEEDHEEDEDQTGEQKSQLIFERKLKKQKQNKSISNLQEAVQTALIKSKRVEIAQNLQINFGSQQRDKVIKQELHLNPEAEVIQQEQMPQNTFAYFKRLLKNTSKSTFLFSKYNSILKLKLEKSKDIKEVEPRIQKTEKINYIQFQGDFQSGNLDFAIKVRENQYNVFPRIDTNTRGHQSWFYFKVKSHYQEQKRIKINICNVKRKFKMIQKGQKIHFKEVNPPTEWKTLDEEIEVSALGNRKYKISFQLSLNPEQQLLISLIPPYTYSQLLKDLEEFERSPDVRVDVLTHTIAGLAVPLVTITKDAGKQKKNKNQIKKKLILMSGRIHPSQTCSSYIISGIIRQLSQNNKNYQQFLSNTIIKIVPMLNPDGVVFGNFRTNYLGDDLNRSFHRTDSSIYPETIALKELGKKIQAEFGENFIAYLDMHGHSSQTNSFVYGPEYESNNDSFFQCRILPKILDRLSKYFKYDMSQFKLQDYKYNTARGYFLKKLKIPAYTIETSYALYKDKDSQNQAPKPMSIPEWKQFGRQIVNSFLSYFKYIQLTKQSPSVFTRGKDKNRASSIFKNEKSSSLPSNQKSTNFFTTEKQYCSSIDFYAIKKQIHKQVISFGKNKKERKEEESSDSDGESAEEDLSEKQKQTLVKKIKEISTPSFLLPKVPKHSLALPSVAPGTVTVGKIDEKNSSTMPKLANKFRQKKLIRPLNLSYEYTQYLLKNISDIASLQPQMFAFNYGKKPQTSIKKQTIIQF